MNEARFVMEPMRAVHERVSDLGRTAITLTTRFDHLCTKCLSDIKNTLQQRIIVTICRLYARICPRNFLTLSIDRHRGLRHSVHHLKRRNCSHVRALVRPPARTSRPSSNNRLVIKLPTLTKKARGPVGLFTPTLNRPGRRPRQRSRRKSSLRNS